tara:strand:+ start:13346 stop:13765 length:420 start_codon:yes stop_codon:yes gene_type:complete
MSAGVSGGEELIEKIIYGVSIFFANSLYDLVKELDEQILVSIVAMFVAFSLNYFKHVVDDHRKITSEHLWWTVVNRWLQTLTMVSGFITIQCFTSFIVGTIEEKEKYYYEVVLYPVLTLMIAIALITIIHEHMAVTKKS